MLSLIKFVCCLFCRLDLSIYFVVFVYLIYFIHYCYSPFFLICKFIYFVYFNSFDFFKFPLFLFNFYSADIFFWLLYYIYFDQLQGQQMDKLQCIQWQSWNNFKLNNVVVWFNFDIRFFFQILEENQNIKLSKPCKRTLQQFFHLIIFAYLFCLCF